MTSIQKIVGSYQTLNDRDRKLVLVMLVIGLPLLVYLLCLRPLYNFYENSKQAFVDNRELLQWMNQQKTLIASSASSSSTASAEKDLIQIVSTEADKQGMSIDRLQPQGADKIRLWSQDVAFSSLVAWLVAVQQHGLTIETVSIDQTNVSGKVSFQGALSR